MNDFLHATDPGEHMSHDQVVAMLPSSEYIVWQVGKLGELVLRARVQLSRSEFTRLVTELGIPASLHESWVESFLDDLEEGVTYPYDEK